MIKIREELSKVIKNALTYDFTKSMTKVGLATIQVINERVEKGVTVDNRPFKSYSKGYQDFKKRKGRQVKPNLQFTGEMMNSLQSEVSEQSSNVAASVYFPDRKHEKSKSNISDIAERNHEIRPFFHKKMVYKCQYQF